jgi:DNA polymerase III alpha subunit
MTLVRPNRFVSLHNHTGFSPFDGLGYPDDHFKFCMENGLDAHAITEHGNMNSYAHAQLWIESWAKSNKDGKFKYIPGIEAYYHPDLDQWARDKSTADAAATDKKLARKLATQQEKLQTKLLAKVDSSDETEEIETSNALTIENEDESKSTKHFNPVNRRHHLVVLPKNQRGLLKIFAAVSESYLKGFYRFPRWDAKSLRAAASDGDLVVSSACIGGLPAFNIFQILQGYKFDELHHSLLTDPVVFEKVVNAVGNTYDEMTSLVGEGNYFLELQFNKLPAQDLVNSAIIEFAKRSGVTGQLIVTCDAHYYSPDVWRERELYKKLGFMNYTSYSPDSLPKSRDELKCELYPKNASQIWAEYELARGRCSYYDDQIVCDAIERSHDVAHGLIGDVKPDRTQKFPNEKLVPEGVKSFNHLVKLCGEGMKKRGLEGQQVYVDRLREELLVIKQMKNADYFISYQKIMELAREACLCGPGRGSGGGSLVNYVLFITDLDPIRWDLPFARFLSIYRSGAPDIDCVNEKHLVVMADRSYKRAVDIVAGDQVLGGDGLAHLVTATYLRETHEGEQPLAITVRADDGTLGWFDVVPRHKFVLACGQVIYANELQAGYRLMSNCGVSVEQVEPSTQVGSKYVDLTVEDDHRFHVVPFDIDEVDDRLYHIPGYRFFHRG